MPSTYRTISGTGTISFQDGYNVSLPFTVDCKADGMIRIQASTNDPSIGSGMFGRLKQTCRMRGTANEVSARVNISAMKLFGQSFSSRSGQMSFSFTFLATGEMTIIYQGLSSNEAVELRFGLINFFFYGPQLNVRLTRLTTTMVFEHTSSLQQLEDTLSAEGFQLSVIARVLIPKSRITQARKAASNIAMLLSFATGTYVSVAYMDTYLTNGGIASSQVWPVRVHRYDDSEPLIDNRLYSSDLQVFLERSLEPYQNLMGRLKLGFALDHCIMAKIAPVVDIGFITAFVGLESLLERLQNQLPLGTKRRGWRKIVARIFRHGRNEFVVLSRLSSALKYYNLSDHGEVSQCVRGDSMPNYETVRNRLVHSGRFPKNVDPVSSYVSLIDVYQRLLLAILNYRGHYIDRSRDFERHMME